MCARQGFYWNDLFYPIPESVRPSGNYTFPPPVQGMEFMVMNLFLYAFLTWYLDNVIPDEYGQRRPLWFFATPSYWGFKCVGCRRRTDNPQGTYAGPARVRGLPPGPPPFPHSGILSPRHGLRAGSPTGKRRGRGCVRRAHGRARRRAEYVGASQAPPFYVAADAPPPRTRPPGGDAAIRLVNLRKVYNDGPCTRVANQKVAVSSSSWTLRTGRLYARLRARI